MTIILPSVYSHETFLKLLSLPGFPDGLKYGIVKRIVITHTETGDPVKRRANKKGRSSNVAAKRVAADRPEPRAGKVRKAAANPKHTATEQRLRESEAMARVLLEVPYAASLLMDPEGIILDANETLAQRFGKTRSEIIGKSLWDFLPPESTEHRKAYLKQVIRDKKPIRFEDERGGIWNDIIGSPILDGRGNVTKVAIVAVDITGRKHDEETLRSYSRRLVELEEELRKKLATELHDELGRGLTALGLNFTIISGQLTDESRGKLGSRIEDTQKLLEEMSGNIRGLMAKLHPPVLDDFGLTAALNWFTGIFSTRTGLPIELQIEEPLPRLSSNKELSLFRIIQEALTNAFKHANAHSVTIRLACIHGDIRLTVMDDGRGFDPVAVASQKNRSWGLTIMRERAESINGRFRIESSPGNGAVIIVETPEDCR
jgi:PAS domain S-box-containing protein